MSGDPNSFQESEFQGVTFQADYSRVGPNVHGNTLINNWPGSLPIEQWPGTVQLIEVTPDKKVVWTFADHRTMRTISSVQLLDVPGDATKGEILH